jgi:hypothetical protein
MITKLHGVTSQNTGLLQGDHSEKSSAAVSEAAGLSVADGLGQPISWLVCLLILKPIDQLLSWQVN